ncbi:MAG: PrgI family protein [Candidatus Magasanikbacteria bacterium]
MQQFVVPQFIDVEDRIFGPITVRQFLILLAAGLFIFIAYKLADFTLFLVLTVIVGSLTLVFAFVRINGQDFHYVILNIIQTIRHPSLRIWRKDYSKKELDYLRKQKVEEVVVEEVVKRAKASHIRDLALIVNTGGFYKPEDNNDF